MAKQIKTDEESILKRNARHRLIGAVALTTFVVVTLPLVFDSQPPPTFNSDIELHIPGELIAPQSNADEPAAKTTEAAPASAVMASAVPAVAVSAVASVTPVAEETKKLVLPPAVSATPAAVSPTISPKPAPVVKAVAEPTTEVKLKSDAEKPNVSSKPKDADSKSKVTESKQKEVTKPSTPPHNGFVIQIGAYANPASAKNMEAKLSQLGFHAYVEKTGGNVRVRVGGFASRDAAEKARKKLAAQGLHPDIINLN